MSSVQELLTRLASQEIKLWVDGDKLRCSGPESLMTAALKSELAQRKIELIEALRLANRSNPAQSLTLAEEVYPAQPESSV